MNGKVIWAIIFAIMIVYVIWYYNHDTSTTESKEESDDLASCLKRKGVKFYGASYCSHCNKQKQMFGASAKNLPYVECETPKNPECAKNHITLYPTWVFPNGKKITGETTIERLKEYSEC